MEEKVKMGVYFTHKGDFNKTEKWLNSLLNRDYLNVIASYGQLGVNALRAATPRDSGLAASSWRYEIRFEKGSTSLVFVNDDIEGGCSVVILLDKGHATKSGSWVPGLHFIDIALEPIISGLEEAVWREVTSV